MTMVAPSADIQCPVILSAPWTRHMQLVLVLISSVVHVSLGLRLICPWGWTDVTIVRNILGVRPILGDEASVAWDFRGPKEIGAIGVIGPIRGNFRGYDQGHGTRRNYAWEWKRGLLLFVDGERGEAGPRGLRRIRWITLVPVKRSAVEA